MKCINIIYFLSIIFILYILSVYYFKHKHKFWSQQPVTQNYKFNITEGIITNNLITANKISNKFKIQINNVNIKKLSDFLKNNYFLNNVNKYIYSVEFIKWLFNYNISFNKIITITDNTKIIGSITSKLNNIVYKDENIKLSYVDFLCVSNDYRNMRISPDLITNIANLNNLNNIKIFMFKIDKSPLPFRYICKMTYYQLNFEDFECKNKENKLKLINDENLVNSYNFFNNNIKKYKLYPNYSLFEFKYYFVNDNILLFIKEDINREIIALSIIVKHTTFLNNKNINNFELLYYINNEDNNEFLEAIIDYLKNIGKNLIVLDIMENKKFIDKYNFIKGMNCYYQMYNYNIVIPFYPNEVAINYI